MTPLPRRLWRLLARTAWLLAIATAVWAAPPAVAPGASPQQEIALPAQAFVRGTPLPTWFQRETRLPDGDPREPIAFLLADSHFRVDATPAVVVHRALVANDATALAQVGQFPIGLQPDFQRVELHWLKVWRNGQASDKLREATVRFYHSERGAEQGLYTGSVTAVVITPDLRPGDILEVIYSLVGQNPVFAGRYVDSASWDTGLPIRWRRVILDHPAGRPVRYRLIGAGAAGAVAARESDRQGRHLVTFEDRELPAIDTEVLVPPDVHPARWIQFSEFRDWRDVASWAADLFRDGGTAVLPVLPATAEPAEGVAEALAFVQENIRYLSISLAENSHRPHPPGEVLDKRYGDCKDKSLLLVHWLRRQGIAADPVLVSTQYRTLEGLLPSPLVFDHAIVQAVVAGRTYYLDPTNQRQGSRLATLAPALPGSDALVATPTTAALVRIPPADPVPAVTNRLRERVQVDRFGDAATMEVETTHWGEEAEAVRRNLARLTPLQIRKAYESLLDRRYPQAQLTEPPRIADDRQENRLSVTLQYRIANLFEQSGDRWSVRYEASNLLDPLPQPASAKRRAPLNLTAFPWAGEYSFALRLPEDYEGRYKPEQRTFSGSVFRFDDTLTFSGRELKVDLRLTLTADRVPAADMPRYLDDLRKANPFVRASLSVSDRDRRVAAISIPLHQLSRQRLEQVLTATATVLQPGRAGGGDLTATLCERAKAAAFLGQTTVAGEAAERMVDDQPTAADALRCRGTVRFILGDFANGIRDLTRALALGPPDADSYYYRGLAHDALGQWAAAATDFAEADRLGVEASARLRARIWETLARRQIGGPSAAPGPIPPHWPGPILALLRGETGIDDVIEAVHRDQSGTRAEESLAEAYFFISRHLAAGNPVRARAYLQRSIDLGPLYSPVLVAARHELGRVSRSPDERNTHARTP